MAEDEWYTYCCFNAISFNPEAFAGGMPNAPAPALAAESILAMLAGIRGGGAAAGGDGSGFALPPAAGVGGSMPA